MAAVTYSSFWGPAVDAYTTLVNKMPRLNSMRRVVNRQGFRVNKELLDTLIGATSGGAALASHSEVSNGTLTTNGGVATPGAGVIASVTDINRVSTAADITTLKEFLFNVNVKPAFPRDLSGNGGGAQS
jgi:hypothetical protein